MSTRLDEIRQRVEASTEGPWTHGQPEIYRDGAGKMEYVYSADVMKDSDTICALSYDGQPMSESEEELKGNLAFIAHARGDVPYLLDLVASLERECQELAGALDFYAKHHHHLNTTAPNFAHEALAEADAEREKR